MISIFQSKTERNMNKETIISGGGGEGREILVHNVTQTCHFLKLATEQLFI